MNGIKIECASDDQRPAFVLDDVQGADFSFVKLSSSQPGRSFSLKQVRDFSLFRSRPIADTELAQVVSKEL